MLLRSSWALIPPTLLSFLFLATPVVPLWPFPPKRFTGNSLIRAGPMGLDDNGRVVAFGDFNEDQFLDVLSLSSDQQTLSVFLWSHEEFTFKKSTSFHHPEPIYNVVPGDFTHDGKLDLLVMSQGTRQSELALSLYVALPEGGFDLNPISVPASTLSQPIPIDTNGDMKIDLLGITPQSIGTSSPIRIWQNAWNASQPQAPPFNMVDPHFDGTQCTLANPHGNAVVDLDGDCLADIFLLCDNGSGNKFYQIWVNNKDAGFSLAKSGSLPSGVQTISFADIDRDGTMDMVFTTCSSVSSSTGVGTDCSINIAYNKQLQLCTSSTVLDIKDGKRTCRPPDLLCSADPNFSFDFTDSSDNNAFVRIPISSLFPGVSGSPSLLVLDTTHNPPIPLPIRLGDANLDGYTDLLFIIDSHTVQDERTPKLVLSVQCARGVAGCSANGSGRRGWKAVTTGAEFLDTITDAKGVAFLDMDEDGTLDIMVQRTGDGGQGKVLFVQNNFYYDAFFLKAIVLNGACDNGWCTIPNSSARYHPFGVSYSGATYKYTVLDTSGRRSAAQVGQLPQTSYHSLLTPYAFFGLGRTNNYIENLFVGSTKHTTQHFINMEGVIPNSKVVILPPSSSNEGAGWKRELYLRPGSWIPWVTVTVVVVTVLLAVIVFVLHLNEKREDELERRRASHHINFDAL
ncbi:hypothetical protein PILCRDRAFT_276328 [Piloderma croceum F 1598]|uniref:T-cell immunomodulatory protein TIP C2 domain-containing protein n=1 Tax=Piloderma croceum (strain F 1598) TaxID=765440 RepID=A0A0C3CCK8_PILCF|nr:hypothetical protein PILCRDRAFT_276328 [Piloderma croceum F 1598]